MSGETLTVKVSHRTPEIEIKKSRRHRVDINNLLSKVRQEKNKKKRENYIFLGLACGAIVVTGVIASL